MRRKNDAEVRFKVTLDDNEASKKIDILNISGSKTSGIMSKIGSVGSAAFKAVSLGITTAGTAMTALLGYGVKYNAEIEQLTTSFEVMTGSAEKAAEITETLKEMGAKTPFETKDLAEVTQLLMNYGIEADTAIERMSMLGDISQGSADKMQRIAMAYGQMSSAGKVSLEDVKQMIEAGFNPLQEISETTGESMASLYDRISDGTLAIDEITASMERSTSKGGKYFQSMEKQSKTLNGQISTLKDNFSSLAGTLANDVSGQLTTSILPEINQLISDMETAFKEDGVPGMIEVMTNGITEMLIGLVEQLPQFIEIGTQIIQSLINGISNNNENLINSIVLAMTNLLNAILDMLPQILQLGIQIIVQLITGIAQQAPELVPQMIDCVILIAETLIDNLDLIIDAGIELILALTEGIFNALPDLIAKLPELIAKLVSALLKLIFEQIPKLGAQLVEKIIEGIFNYWNKMIDKVKEFFKGTIFETIVNKAADMAKAGLELIKGLWNGIKDAKEWLMNKISGFFGGIVDSVKDFFGIASPSKLFFEIGGYLDEGFIEGINSMKKDIEKQVDATFGSGLDYLYNGYDNYNLSIPDTSYINSSNQTIYLESNNSNTSVLTVDGKVLAETVNDYNDFREVAV